MTKTVRIENIEDARRVAPEYGIVFPAGQGRPPMKALNTAIKDAGDTIDGTHYFPEVWPEPNRTPRAGKEFVLSLASDVTKTVMVERETKKGKRKMPSKQTVRETKEYRLSAQRIRELSKTLGVKGRISREALLTAFATEVGVDAESIPVTQITQNGTPVVKPSVKAVEDNSEPVAELIAAGE